MTKFHGKTMSRSSGYSNVLQQSLLRLVSNLTDMEMCACVLFTSEVYCCFTLSNSVNVTDRYDANNVKR